MNYQTMIERRDNHVYYNVVITNLTEHSQQATFYETRTDNIINNVGDYHITCIKFTCPTALLPIMQTFPTGSTATNQTTGFSVTLTGTGGTASQQFLTYIPIDNTGNTYIYNYRQVVDMINVSLAAGATAIGLTAPFIGFDSSSQLFSMYIPTTYNSSDAIYFNPNLQAILPSFPFSYYNTVDYSNANSGKYAMFPNSLIGQNSSISNYNQIPQEYASTISLYQPRSLRFVSTLLPSKQEFIPITGSSILQGGDNSQPILIDFDLPVSDAIANIKPFIQYYPTGEYRLIDLQGQGPINRFDLTVYWVDEVNNIYPLFIDPNQSLTIKFLFRKKEY
jgi:hypothetical protein